MCKKEHCGRKSSYIWINKNYCATVYNLDDLKRYIKENKDQIDPFYFGRIHNEQINCDDVKKYCDNYFKAYNTLPEFGDMAVYGEKPVWSGDVPPPQIGDVVTLPWGWISGEILAYFTEQGFLGVVVKPEIDPNSEYFKSKKQDDPNVLEYLKDKACFFGNEITKA